MTISLRAAELIRFAASALQLRGCRPCRHGSDAHVTHGDGCPQIELFHTYSDADIAIIDPVATDRIRSMRAARVTTPRQNRPHILVASDNARLPGWFQHRFMGAIYSSPRSSEDCLRILRQTASQSVYGLHATCVSVMGHGIVIVGAPGAGKSRLALDLIRRGHTLIADDHVLLMQNGAGEWRAVGPAAWYGWLHLRHAGFFDIKRLDGCRINGVETLSGIVSLNHTEAEQKKELAKSGFSALANIPILLRTRYAPELTAAIVEREVDSCLEVRNATARRIA